MKRDAESLWRKLVRLYEGGAHEALGYTSWHAYAQAEFGYGGSRAYQVLDAERVADTLQFTNGGTAPANERQARELITLMRTDENLAVEVWNELNATYGDTLTASHIRDARLNHPQFVPDLLREGRSDEWYTPAEIADAARDVLGVIDLDPAPAHRPMPP